MTVTEAMIRQPAVQLAGVSKSYFRAGQEIPVLEDITLDIGSGEFLALMGPSGSGKSTLLNLIAGIDTPDSGRITVAGVEIQTLPEKELAAWRAANVGFIFQFYNLMPVLTAFENIELPLLLTGLSRKRRKEHVEAVLGLVNLLDRQDHYPSELSGGQQQRVAIARALAADPEFIFFDEPTTGLDPIGVYNIQQLMLRLQRGGKTTLMVTHDMPTAFAVSDRFSFISDARLVFEGTKDELEKSGVAAIREFFSPTAASLFHYDEEQEDIEV